MSNCNEQRRFRFPLFILLVSGFVLLGVSAPSIAYPGSVIVQGYVTNNEGWQDCEALSPVGICFPL